MNPIGQAPTSQALTSRHACGRRSQSKGELLPVLPLRDIVVFPHMIVPLFVGREKSVRALEAVMKDDKQILLVAQKNATQDDPSAEDIYRVGTVSTILQLLKLPDGTVKVLVEGGTARQHHRLQGDRGVFRGVRRADPGSGDRRQGAGGARPLGRVAVRAIHQAEQEDRAGGAGFAEPDRGAEQARRHRRQPSQSEDRREAGTARGRQGQRSAGARVRRTWNPRSACCRSRSASATA